MSSKTTASPGVLASPQALLLTLLSLQSSVGRPSEEICNQIAGLQNLAEIGNVRNTVASSDWRRNGAPATAEPVSKWRSKAVPQRVAMTTPQQQPQVRQPEAVAQTAYIPGQGRYQSRFRNSNQPVEEKILNNIILSKLNKFSEATYPNVRDFLYQILGDEKGEDIKEFTRDFMRLVFRKAASEEVFCPLYARLLTEISSKYSVILEEMNLLSDNYLEIFEEVTEEGNVDYDTFVRKNSEKKYRLGYSQFLAELSKQEILPLQILSATFCKLVTLIRDASTMSEKRVLVEEYTDCLLRMTRVLKGRTTRFSREARELLLPPFQEFFTTLQEKKGDFPSCSAKSRFILMDIYDILKT